MTLVQGDRDARVSTHPSHEDDELRGRTYAVPFDAVWTAALRLAGGGLARWRVTRAEDVPGVIQAEVRPLLRGGATDVLIRIGLDRDGQTRVDLVASSRARRGGRRGSRRLTRRFLRALDRDLATSRGGAPAARRPAASSGGRVPGTGAHA
ncbi:MAG: hypothetical protein RQ751_00910 [Longimicrobiales bacterium]|nr:hypothetical protein [Longimicrobiales bacterium]